MKILFMGTPDFALCSLRALCEGGYNVAAVVTQPDKPKGRGHVLTPPPVKVYAQERGIEVLQPQTLRSEEFMQTLERIDPDLIAVVAYGKILPIQVLSYPRLGCVNVHGSLLPEYRGAAPMQRAIIDGKKVTGITTMLMAEGLDTGDMLLRQEAEIGENDNFEVVHDRLASIGASLLVRTIDGLNDGSILPVPQGEGATYAQKIEKADCYIDFSMPVQSVHDLIRGLSPMPLAYTHTPDGRLLKITESRVVSRDKADAECGEVISLGSEIQVACADGVMGILGVIPEGKGKMRATDLINGRKISLGDRLS